MVIPSPAMFSKVMLSIANVLFEHALTGQQFNSIKQLFHCKTFPPKLFPSNIHPKCLCLGRERQPNLCFSAHICWLLFTANPFKLSGWNPFGQIPLQDFSGGLMKSEGKTFVSAKMIQLFRKTFSQGALEYSYHQSTSRNCCWKVQLFCKIFLSPHGK